MVVNYIVGRGLSNENGTIIYNQHFYYFIFILDINVLLNIQKYLFYPKIYFNKNMFFSIKLFIL